jgi:nitrite reductase/ring-hydroxylating ferredoxin subunit
VAQLVEVARVGQIPLQRGLNVKLGEYDVAVFNVNGNIFAVDGACIRCASLLALGTVEGVEVVCPGCGWRYDVTTGRLPAIPQLRIDTFAVEVVGSSVMVWNPFT